MIVNYRNSRKFDPQMVNCTDPSEYYSKHSDAPETLMKHASGLHTTENTSECG